MRALTATELLAVWENGAGLSTPERALLLLGAAQSEHLPEALGRLTVGQRDGLLLQLRAAAFGTQLEATAGCPQCREKLELAFTTDDLQPPLPPAALPEIHSLEAAGHVLAFRLPNGLDLIELARLPDPAAAEAVLLRRCVLSAQFGAQALAVEALPAPVVSALADRWAEADPQADLQLALNCPACEHRWTEAFDIAAFFWREIEAWAGRLLREVHALASAYGWSEAEIVALSPARRRRYLEMVAA